MPNREVAPLGEPKLVPIGSIHPSEGNPRRIPARAVEMVAASLREFGWQQPIVVDASGGILAGHTRHRAALSLGLKTVPVVEFRGTPDEARAFRIADNRTSDYSSWDFPALAAELEEIGDDFREVLGLADWEGVIASFDDLTAPTANEELSAAGSPGFDVVVTFATKEAALRAADALFGMGATDVRHKLR